MQAFLSNPSRARLVAKSCRCSSVSWRPGLRGAVGRLATQRGTLTPIPSLQPLHAEGGGSTLVLAASSGRGA